MKYIDEYRDPELTRSIISQIKSLSRKNISLMEVCGSHTVAIHRNGIKNLLPHTVRLLSGPGCPVCVTSQADIDRAIHLAAQRELIMTTFGDMMRVPGSTSSLLAEKAAGADIRVVYSPADALPVAGANRDRQVVFFAAGFETTAPTIAATILRSRHAGLDNFSVFSVHKLIPPAMKALMSSGETQIDAFILPGHVSVIIGAEAYSFLSDFKKPAVVCGFEPVDILQGILMLVRQLEKGESRIEIAYRRGVDGQGNVKARELMYRVFEEDDAWWRGIGLIPSSGLSLKGEYRDFDARRFLKKEFMDAASDLPGCSCGDVLKGIIEPEECPLFGGECTPEDPVGPCMVSSEGSCAAHYKYGQL